MFCFHHPTIYHSSFLLGLSTTSSTSKRFLSCKNKNYKLGWASSVRCNAISKPTTEDYTELQDDLPLYKTHLEIVDHAVEGVDYNKGVIKSSGIEPYVERIKGMLKSMDDGEISISPYDTAWIALVKSNNGGPLFPSSLQWIIHNQLLDGSWGDHLFSAHDRIINTLACIIALKSWDVYPDKCNKGIAFLRENISKMQDENMEHMPIGFEIAFPGLIEIARGYGIEVAQDTSATEEIYAKRNYKLKRIPIEIMYRMPTTLLHSLEGMAGLDWEKLLKLQSKDGSFLFSPASTAYALMQTKDGKCLAYLNRIVQRFNGGAPNVYPIDLFEHIWVVDRLQRLGISRFFQDEIEECVSYVYRYWTERGICWTRNSEVQDIDDTAMGFRILRLHGYHVSADVFKNFEKDGEFFCFVGQSNQAVTGMYNLLRASQLQFPGDKILENARIFSSKFLWEKQASNQLLDKWTMTKDLHGEVTYALNVPWYANLPRIEARFYLEQYGGEEEAWIGKTIYRMPKVSNNVYLELAKLDYNNIQALHRQEWSYMLRWHSKNELEELGVSQRRLLDAYFLAAVTMFEPEKAKYRLAWVKTVLLVEAIDFEFTKDKSSLVERREFVNLIEQSYYNSQSFVGNGGRSKIAANYKGQILVGLLLSILNELSTDAHVSHGTNIRNYLFHAWEKWLKRWEEEGDRHRGEAELLVHTIELCAGRWLVSDPHTLSLLEITNRLCCHFGHLQDHDNYNKVQCATINGTKNKQEIEEVEMDLQKMTQIVLSRSINGANPCLKQTCLALVKTYFYIVHFSPQDIHFHIEKVLFQKVD